MQLFQSGDYEYLCKMYGLSGASGMSVTYCFCTLNSNLLSKLGRHNCLWCLVPSSKLVESPSCRGSFQLRTLESLRDDHRRFMTAGKGNLKAAKNYNNIIGEILLDIPLTHVS